MSKFVWIGLLFIFIITAKMGAILYDGGNDDLNELLLTLDDYKNNLTIDMSNTPYNSSMTIEEMNTIRVTNSVNTYLYAHFYVLFNIMEYGTVVGYQNPDTPYTLFIWCLVLLSIFLLRELIIFILANIYLLFKLGSKVFTRGII